MGLFILNDFDYNGNMLKNSMLYNHISPKIGI